MALLAEHRAFWHVLPTKRVICAEKQYFGSCFFNKTISKERNSIKETATKILFLNGNSYHPQCIFKSIVFGESVRLRRLNETNELYLKDLERLKKKCIDSYFNKKVVEKIINLANTWTDRFGPKPLNKNKTTDPMLIWASAFSN